MKKTLLFLMSLTLCLGMSAQSTNTTGTLSVTKTVNLVPGGDVNEDEGYFTIAFDDVEEAYYTAFQMDLYLPDGYEFAMPEGWETCGTNNEDGGVYPKVSRKYVHTYAENLQSKNHFFVMVYDGATNKAFLKHSGDLLDIYVKATPYAKPGDFQVTIKDIKFVSPDEMKYLYVDQVLTAGTTSAETTIPVKVTSANKISTAIFPFSCDTPDELEAYTASGIEGEYIKLIKADGINAFTPYIIYSENGYEGSLTGNIDAENYPASSMVSDGYFTGVLVDSKVDAGYVLQNKGEGPMFYKIGSTPFTIPAGKCFANPAAANAPSLAFNFGDGDVDGIHSVDAPSLQSKNLVFDLQGKQVLNPRSGQIYIINGQKFLKR